MHVILRCKTKYVIEVNMQRVKLHSIKYDFNQFVWKMYGNILYKYDCEFLISICKFLYQKYGIKAKCMLINLIFF